MKSVEEEHRPTPASPPLVRPTPPVPSTAPAPQPPKKSSALKWVLIVLGIIIALGLITGVGCWYVARRAIKTLEKEAAKVTEQIPGITIPGVTEEEEVRVTEEEEVTLPTADVAGSDITEVPRYPGSVRTAWSKEENEETATYQVKATVTEVRDHYTKLLKEKDWTLTSSVGINGTALEFEKKPAYCEIFAFDVNGSTVYTITYWPEY